jgi:hypothetical protein
MVARGFATRLTMKHMRSFASVCVGLCFAMVASAETVPECRPVSGVDELWSKPGLRFVLVGEMHGTSEAPAIFYDLACSARSLKRPIVVGIERPSREQGAIDAFLAPQDHASAVRALLSEKGWNTFDGRSSRAMLLLLEELRALKLTKLVSEVVAFDDSRSGESAAQRENRMASALMAVAGRHTGALVVALTGNLHASKKPMAQFGSYPFMAMLLPQTETLSLFVNDKGGEAWTQTSDGCGPHKLKSTGGEHRGVFLSAGLAPFPGYDGVLSTGLASSASLPAIGDPPPQPACSKE